MPNSDFVWDLLEGGNIEALRELAPADFNWRAFHPEHNMTPLQVVVTLGFARVSSEPYLELAKWLIEQGADPAQAAPNVATVAVVSDDDCKYEMQCAGKSAIALVAHCMNKLNEEMERKGTNWTTEISNSRKFLDIFAEASKNKVQSEKVSVDVGVIELWERVYAASNTHDVTFETSDGYITAHSLLLTHASPVLSAMLSSTMREGSQKRIDVKDASSDGVTFFLDLLYTGSSCSDVECAGALVALDLAHRWQVQCVVNMVVGALCGMLTDESFVPIAESAALKGLGQLSTSCINFASRSAFIAKRQKEGTLPRPVLELLCKSSTPTVQPTKKRRTF